VTSADAPAMAAPAGATPSLNGLPFRLSNAAGPRRALQESRAAPCPWRLANQFTVAASHIGMNPPVVSPRDVVAAVL
jgi:hypothetical protein